MIQVGQKYSFGVTLSASGLFVAALIFDDSGISPVQVGSAIPMLNYDGFTYRGSFTPTEEKSYLIKKIVFTDGTYTTRDANYLESDETQQAVFGGLSSIVELIGVIDSQEIVGVIENNSLIGQINV